ncbi:MAG: competence/damage-inducible protein A [Planctomycetes bacterium]|nr:competence/damage-inducible protein A [Planctomycetota bacterium]
MKAAIISIGNELLSGLTVDTNAAFLSERLMSVGVATVCGYTVGDDVEMISEAIGNAARHADVILITGGLGPTDDDLTRTALASFLGVELLLDNGLLREIAEFFKKRNYHMADKNRVQAYLPKGASALTNELGTAPGIMAKYQGKTIVCMPGVPYEMKKMFDDSVLSIFAGAERVVISKKLRCFGAGESTVAERLGDLMERGRNPLINCTVDASVITLHIVATADSSDEARAMIAGDETRLRSILGPIVYGVDGETLGGAVGKILASRRKTISVAESCTGGLLAKMLTDTPDSSEYFAYGWVTYCNEAKVSQLGVDGDIIAAHGAVSEPVAAEMAAGARKRGGSDIGIGITGIAGPGGGSEQKPVGLVYICIDLGGESVVKRYVFPHSREKVRLRSALTALDLLRHRLHD